MMKYGFPTQQFDECLSEVAMVRGRRPKADNFSTRDLHAESSRMARIQN